MADNIIGTHIQGVSDEGNPANDGFPVVIAFKDATGNKRVPQVEANGSLDVTVVGGAGGGPATIADCADVTQGCIGDAAVTSNAPGTVSGKLRGLVTILASVWDSINGRLKVDGSGVTQPVSGSVSVSNFPATQPVSGTVTANQGTSPWVVGDGGGSLTVDDGGGSLTVDGTIAATQSTSPWVVSGTVALGAGSATIGKVDQGVGGASAWKVDGSAVTQPVSGTVAVSNFPATQPVSGTVTANQGTSPWVVSGTVTANPTDAANSGTINATGQTIDTVIVGRGLAAVQLTGVWSGFVKFQVSVDATGTFNDVTCWREGNNAPVAAGATITSNDVYLVPVFGGGTLRLLSTGTWTSGTLTATIAVTPHPTVTYVAAGQVTAQQGGAGLAAWKVDGSGVTQPVSGTVTAIEDITTGRVVKMLTGSLTTTAATADQVVLTYTVTGGKTLYLEYLMVSARFTTLSTTGALMGTASLENPAATKLITDTFTNPTVEEPERIALFFSEPLPIAAGTVIRVVCTPAGVTSTLWTANFGGYEK